MRHTDPTHDRGASFSAGLRRVFGGGENPLEWSIPFGRVAGLTLRMHLVFPVYVISRLIWSISRDEVSFTYMLPLMGSFLVLVLAHELGHAYACRRVGGRADRVILWPLGGLAEMYPPPHWRASFMTALGGPAVNLALFPILASWVYIATGSLSAVFFFPLEELRVILSGVVTPAGEQPYWLIVIWSLHFANLMLILFNLLIPMMPLDSGRLTHALLWKYLGWKTAMEITTIAGIVCGGALGVFAVAGNESGLLVIAGLGIWVCYQENRRLKFLDSGGEERPTAHAGGPGLDEGSAPATIKAPGAIRVSPARGVGDAGSGAAERPEDSDEVDRILAKISEVGMDGLSADEKRTLKRASKRDRETE
ncbi:MAG: Zn-dependent protease [Phycisphaerales bacterium]|jgi:Zn-dependent protease